MPKQKLIFNTTYYPSRSTMEELQTLSAPNKEYKKVFPNLVVIWFWNGKGLKDCLV